jgi:hypothetical protein
MRVLCALCVPRSGSSSTTPFASLWCVACMCTCQVLCTPNEARTVCEPAALDSRITCYSELYKKIVHRAVQCVLIKESIVHQGQESLHTLMCSCILDFSTDEDGKMVKMANNTTAA